MKVTDRLARVLSTNGINRVYGVQGGSVAHIFDSLEQVGIQVKYLHHEESAALAAMAESLSKSTVGTLVVTTGPAGTNAITGVLGAWQDSVPLLIISGAARSNQLSYGTSIRQFGSQEAPILEIVKPITKATYLVTKFDDIEEIICEALEVCQSGRPGPVWIDIPIDVQLISLPMEQQSIRIPNATSTAQAKITSLDSEIENLVENLEKSHEPVLILGGGVRSYFRQNASALKSINATGLPVILTWTASTLASCFENYIGIAGPFGHRSTNSRLRNSDLVLAVGTNLGTNVIGNDVGYLAEKEIYFCNIDAEQIKFNQTRFKSIEIEVDSGDFFEHFFRSKPENTINRNNENFLPCLKEDYDSFQAALEETASQSGFLHSHGVVEWLTRSGVPNLVIDGGGTALYSGFQAAHLEKVTNVVCASAISSMGTALAQSLPFCDGDESTLVIIGDGSFFMALRDLASLKFDQKLLILIINNRGYLAIRHTQSSYLSKRFYGTFYADEDQLPSIEPIIRSFKFDYIPLKTVEDLKKIDLAKIQKVTVVEAFCDPDQAPMWPVATSKINN